MKRVFLKVAYDGTNYCGWQVQDNGVTIESVLNGTLSELFGEDIEVIGASRTDSGVHALGNVAVFDTQTRMPAEKVAPALNTRLPSDIRVQKSCQVPDDFHPRKVDSIKTYEYCILNRQTELPAYRSNTCYFRRPLDVDRMREAYACLIGEHDFSSFCSTHTQALSTVRTIYSLHIEKEGDIIRIRISGNGFLYNMVRIIAGTLMQVGVGRYEPSDVARMLAARDRSKAGPTAPAKGLTLLGIEYPDYPEL